MTQEPNDEELFESARERVQVGTFSVNDDERLMLYALFKMATTGRSTPPTARPSVLDPVGRAKWDAWTDFGGSYRTADAKKLYSALVLRLSER